MKVSLKLRWLLAVVSLVCIGSSEFAAGAADFKYVTIYKAEKDRSSMHLQFTKLRDGTLLCTFRDSKMRHNKRTGRITPWGTPGSEVMCVRSRDNGKTWSDTPTLIFQDFDSNLGTSSGGLGYQAKDGTILIPIRNCNGVFNPDGSTRHPEGSALRRHWKLMAISRDNGHTWACRNLPSAPFFSDPAHGGIIQMNDSSLWMVDRVRGYQIDYAKAMKGMITRNCVRIMESKDDGKTWSHYGYIGYDPTRPKETESMPGKKGYEALTEPAVVQLPSRKIVVIFRPRMLQGISLDRGRTWKIGPSTLSSGRRRVAFAPSMRYSKSGPAGGTLVLAYGRYQWKEKNIKGGICISFSHDEGQTWGHSTRIDGGGYPCLYELEKDSGKFLCGYYRSSTLLKGAFFSVPFPTGIRSTASMKDSGLPCITVEWDAYKGKGSGDYEYRVYRSTKETASLEDSKLVFSGENINSYEDQTVENNQTYYYRVATCLKGKVVNQSWQTSAKVIVND